jgi:hypothetical protein
LDRRLGGPQSQSGFGDEEKNSQPLPEFEPLLILFSTYSYVFQLISSLQSLSHFPMRASCPAHLILHELITRVIFVDEYKL